MSLRMQDVNRKNSANDSTEEMFARIIEHVVTELEVEKKEEAWWPSRLSVED